MIVMLNFTDVKSLPKMFSYLRKNITETFLSMIDTFRFLKKG